MSAPVYVTDPMGFSEGAERSRISAISCRDREIRLSAWPLGCGAASREPQCFRAGQGGLVWRLPPGRAARFLGLSLPLRRGFASAEERSPDGGALGLEGLNRKLRRWPAFAFHKEVSGSRRKWRGGGLMDGAPLMRFMKRIGGAAAPENDSLSTRLNSVTNRGKAEGSNYAGLEGEQPQKGSRKRFWSPDELPESPRS